MFRSIISSSFWLSVYCFLRSCGRNIVSFCYFCLYTFTTQSSNTATRFAYTESSWAEHNYWVSERNSRRAKKCAWRRRI